MKLKLLLMVFSLMGFVVAKANVEPPTDPEKGKKNDLAGVILHSENKKPLKDVIVTAYLLSRKEKAVQTDETGAYGFEELKPGTYKFVFEKSFLSLSSNEFEQTKYFFFHASANFHALAGLLL